MKNYYRIILGSQNIYAQECYEGNYIGANYGIHQDLTNELSENLRDFNAQFRDIWLQSNSGKSNVAAGLSCGMLYTICKGIQEGDIVLCPDGSGNYYVGEVISGYSYHPETNLPHRRKVRWFSVMIDRSAMSQELNNSTGLPRTSVGITQYRDEIERLIGNVQPPTITSNDSTIEDTDTSKFILEKHLEDFLVQNWASTELGQTYDIYQEDGELIGQQYPSDTGPLDILAISKDQKTLLVVELKKGRASDSVIGQIQRYMGYIKEELAEQTQDVRGVIIALEQDRKLQRALSMTQNIDFYEYEVKFRLKTKRQ